MNEANFGIILYSFLLVILVKHINYEEINKMYVTESFRNR